MDLNATLTGLAVAGRTDPGPTSNAAAAQRAIDGFADALREAEAQAEAAMTTGADPHMLVTAMAESKLAVDTVVTIRDRVVEAYQEILRMPV
ncbi:flagellar hook-basal body complex protein FliE [Jannaschia sp. KMU-145]|uniref:flagellar hook-basal body complex protein FliE n=1 Tax=Jannaschia halovivens TaxID=3388667 RepID=UPI00396B2078